MDRETIRTMLGMAMVALTSLLAHHPTSRALRIVGVTLNGLLMFWLGGRLLK